jgi:hypothetical protein
MKTLIKALLGASMLMPIAAQAQQEDRRERRMEMRAERGDRGDRGGGFQPRAPRQVQAQAQVEAPAPARPAPQFRNRYGGDRPQYRAGAQAQTGTQWQQRRDAGGDLREQRRSAIRQNLGQQFGGNGSRDDRGDARRDYRPDNGAGFRGDRADRRDDRRDNRRDYRGNGRNDRQDIARDRQRGQWDRNRGYAGRNGYGSSFGGNSFGGGSFDQRQGWNRGWRNDNRYDWNRYRSGNSSLYRLPRYYAPNGWGNGYRRFSVGITLSSILWDQNYWIDDPWSYRLPEAYGPYRWVRYYDDALLVDIGSGQVVDTVYDIFY